jgi:hypothetical protein
MSEQPLTWQGIAVLSLRQIDRLNDAPKGTAFRAFKRVRDRLVEGQDFFVIDPAAADDDGQVAALIESLDRHDGRYASSRVVILLSEKAYAHMSAVASLSGR